jgi:hypothetical protein
MEFKRSYVGGAAITFGVIVFIIFTGQLIVRIMGVCVALALVNYGLNLLDKPSIVTVIKEFLHSVGRE